MRIRLGRFVILLAVSAMAVFGWRRLERNRVANHPTGIWVYVSRTCSVNDPSNNRTIVLQIRADGETYLNAESFSEKNLLAALSVIYEKREERVLRVTANDEVSYGRVVEVLGDIKARIPRLAIVLIPRGTPAFVMSHWCISSADILPGDR